jgi:hypothetical protein
MPSSHTFIAKIKDLEAEQFLLLTVAEDYSAITHTAEPMSEGELRGKLHNSGMPELEIRSHIEHARKHPA